MKKKLTIIVSTIAILFLLLMVVAYFQLNSLIALLKPQIETKIAELSGGEIKINEINAQLFPQVGIKLNDITFKKVGLVETHIKSANATLELLPLLSKNVQIKELIVEDDRLQVTIPNIKNPVIISDINFKTSISAKTDSAKLSNLQLDAKIYGKIPFNFYADDITLSVNDKSGNVNGIKIEVGNLPINLASVSFSLPTKNISVKGILANLDLSKLPEIVAVLFEKGIFPFPPLIAPKGKLKFIGDYGIANSLIAGNGKVDLSDFSVALLGNRIESMSLSSDIKVGKNLAEVTTKNITLVAKVGVFQSGTPINIDITELSNKISFDNLNVNFELTDLIAKLNGTAVGLLARGEFQGQSLKVNSYSFSGFGGTATGESSLSLRDMGFHFTSSAKELSIPAVMSFINSPNQKLKGQITSANLDLTGLLTDPLGTSSGPVTVQLNETYLEGINFVKSVFKEINSIPIIGEMIKAGLPQSINSALQSEITPIHDLKANIQLAKGVATIKKTNLISDLFTLEGNGTFGLANKNVDFSSMFFLKPDVTTELTNRVKELKYGVNESGSLEVPINVSGTVPNFIVVPNIRKIVERAGKGALKEKATDVLKDILNKKSGGAGGKLLDGLLGGF